MANNRIYLKNKLTGDRICIAKHLATGWYVPGITTSPEQFATKLNDWFDKQLESFWQSEWFVELEYELSEEESNAIDKKISDDIDREFKSAMSNRGHQPVDQAIGI